VPELLAEGELKARYEDMKAVLRVPWMGVVTMSFAHYRAFYDALWQGARTLCASHNFTDACHRLRHLVEEKVSALGPPPLRKRLAQIGYAPRELQEIDESIEIFSEGNFPTFCLRACCLKAGNSTPHTTSVFKRDRLRRGPRENLS
jgi:hypothetical protein